VLLQKGMLCLGDRSRLAEQCQCGWQLLVWALVTGSPLPCAASLHFTHRLRCLWAAHHITGALVCYNSALCPVRYLLHLTVYRYTWPVDCVALRAAHHITGTLVGSVDPHARDPHGRVPWVLLNEDVTLGVEKGMSHFFLSLVTLC
jgi:hypothetical protein